MNTTTLYSYLLDNMPKTRVVALKGIAFDRDFLDHAERKVSVELRIDGTVLVDGREVLSQSGRESWVDAMHAAAQRTGELPLRVMAEEVLAVPIGIREGHALHVLLGQNKIRDHYAYVSAIIGRDVDHLRDISAEEAHQVRFSLAMASVAA